MQSNQQQHLMMMVVMAMRTKLTLICLLLQSFHWSVWRGHCKLRAVPLYVSSSPRGRYQTQPLEQQAAAGAGAARTWKLSCALPSPACSLLHPRMTT